MFAAWLGLGYMCGFPATAFSFQLRFRVDLISGRRESNSAALTLIFRHVALGYSLETYTNPPVLPSNGNRRLLPPVNLGSRKDLMLNFTKALT